MSIDKDFIEETIKIWQPYCSERELTTDDALDMISNISSFFELLNQWEISTERERAS